MAQESILALKEKKEQYLEKLYKVSHKSFIATFQNMYDDVKTKNRKPSLLLKEYQEALCSVAEWKDARIIAELNKFIGKYEKFPGLVTQLFKIYLGLLYHLNKNKFNYLSIPSPYQFVQHSYLGLARSLWREPFVLFHKVDKVKYQKNLLRLEDLVWNAIRSSFSALLHQQINKEIEDSSSDSDESYDYDGSSIEGTEEDSEGDEEGEDEEEGDEEEEGEEAGDDEGEEEEVEGEEEVGDEDSKEGDVKHIQIGGVVTEEAFGDGAGAGTDEEAVDDAEEEVGGAEGEVGEEDEEGNEEEDEEEDEEEGEEGEDEDDEGEEGDEEEGEEEGEDEEGDEDEEEGEEGEDEDDEGEEDDANEDGEDLDEEEDEEETEIVEKTEDQDGGSNIKLVQIAPMASSAPPPLKPSKEQEVLENVKIVTIDEPILGGTPHHSTSTKKLSLAEKKALVKRKMMEKKTRSDSFF